MIGLKIKGTIAEGPAALDTLSAADAELLIDGVFEIRILHKSPFDSP
jgi:hypothetical protein